MSVLTLNLFLLRKCRLIFEFRRYFIIFFSTSGAVSVKTGRDQFLVGHKLIFYERFMLNYWSLCFDTTRIQFFLA